MIDNKNIGFIGAGNMAEAIIKGLLESKRVTPAHISASDLSGEKLGKIAEKYEVTVRSKNFEVVKTSEIIFIAVKPKEVPGVLRDIAPELTEDKLLISIAAGVKTSTIRELLAEAGLSHPVRLVRAMPNTPALVGEAMTGLYAGSEAGLRDENLALSRDIFSSIGQAIIVEDEELLHAVTALSGSGPAFVYFFMKAMSKAGEKAGLCSETSQRLAMQTTLGAARLAIKEHEDLDLLIRKVASPGGTTEAGLKVLEKSGLNEGIEKTILAAEKRSKELSGS